MLTEAELIIIEKAAIQLAQESGKLLMSYFRRPLDVTYKLDNQRSPVTDADYASNQYLQTEINRQFPSHSILSEESEEGPDDSGKSEITWVLDPLDGTSNFMNGLPIFGVSIGVLEQGRPIVAAIFLPSVTNKFGDVYHARAGGGAFCNNQPLAKLGDGPLPTNSILVAMPSFFLRMFNFRDPIRRYIGDIRSTGSIAHDLAQIADGVFKYAVQSRPWIWDVAAGVLLVQEAGGTVLELKASPKRWVAFESFAKNSNDSTVTISMLRNWREVLVVGNDAAAHYISSNLSIRRNLIFRARFKFKIWLDRRRQKTKSPS